MTVPAPTVEIAFGDRWDDTSPTWVDVSAACDSVSYDRRYGWETGSYQGGRCSFTLFDSDRSYDPFHGAGAYYGSFRPNTQVRVKLDSTVVWTGFAESFVRSWSPHGRGVTTISGYDGWTIVMNATSQALVGAAVVDTALVGSSIVGGTFSVGTTAELTSVRVTAILNAAAWPSSWRAISTGAVTMPAEVSDAPRSLADALQDCAVAEQGPLYPAKDGTLTFIDRFTAATATRVETSQYTFSNVAGDTAVRYYPISAEINGRDLVNTVSVVRVGSDTAAVYEDASSIASYGARAASFSDMRVVDDLAALANAQRIVAGRSSEVVTIPPIAFDVMQDPSQELTAAASIELHDRVTVKFSSPGGGSTFESDFHVTGVAGSWSAGQAVAVTVDLVDAALVDRLMAGTWDVVGTAVVGTATAAY